MKSKLILSVTLLSACFAATIASANPRLEAEERARAASGEYIQSVHVVNLLSNATIPDPGMTRTPIMVRYYNGNKWPCWSYTINYQDDYTVHAGPSLGCQTKVDLVVIEPMIVADRLNTYRVPDRISLDTSKFSSHIIVTQDQAPAFDVQSGLVSVPGTMRIQVQADPQ